MSAPLRPQSRLMRIRAARARARAALAGTQASLRLTSHLVDDVTVLVIDIKVPAAALALGGQRAAHVARGPPGDASERRLSSGRWRVPPSRISSVRHSPTKSTHARTLAQSCNHTHAIRVGGSAVASLSPGRIRVELRLRAAAGQGFTAGCAAMEAGEVC